MSCAPGRFWVVLHAKKPPRPPSSGLAWRAQAGLDNTPLTLVGSAELCRRYQLALRHYSGERTLVLDNTAPAGLLLLARAAGLTPAHSSTLESA